MNTISIRLPDKLLEEIDKLVTEGTYASRTEALRDAARQMLRTQKGMLQGKPPQIPKDEILKETLKDLDP